MSQPLSPSTTTQFGQTSSSHSHNHNHNHSSGHSRNASTYISAEAGRPSSSATSSSSYSLTQRSPSPSPTKPTFGFIDQLQPSQQSSSSSSSALSPLSQGSIIGNNGPISLDKSLSASSSGTGIISSSASMNNNINDGPWSKLTPQRVGRAIGARFMRAVRRGNLPFLLVFFSCTIVFFSALAGVGYREPSLDSVSTSTSNSNALPPGPGEFRVGGPVFDDRKGLERRIAEQRALEESWAKKRRPKDGAWMRKQRDDKAIRRKPQTATTSSSQQTDGV
ncbi:uncharacterized protein IL334_007588 [Kwoniella shivajii]|uniref:Transmembrane protein n=1 Tax=Kwoniella shivajii TaxID=564305 RepID=A0ABZ1D9L6_9TREE|nr:hypothetical protein IL334_007588 [Kwoniella shivajii]